jgi:hypothetical protein
MRSLRELEPHCHPLVHLGMNSRGKTIRSPLDGFCPVPNATPPLYVMVEAQGLAHIFLVYTHPSPPGEHAVVALYNDSNLLLEAHDAGIRNNETE